MEKNNDSMNVDNDATQQGGEKIVWTDECANVYKNELESDEFLNSLFMATNVLSTSVNDGLNQFVNALYSAAACMVRSVGHNTKRFNDWFDYECIQKQKEVKRLLKRAQRCKKEKDKKEKRKEYAVSRKEYVKLRKAKETEFEEQRLKKLKDSMNDSKTFWSVIRSVNRKSRIYNEISIEQWYNHFWAVFNDSYENVTQEETIVDDEDDSEPLFNGSISKEEVVAGINHLKSGKSTGPDNITSEMLKNANVPIIEFLVKLFNQLFQNGKFPTEWAKSIIIPIHKKGDINIPIIIVEYH
jgi:hypothetical protein